MSDPTIVERVDLQKKDKSELQTIVSALGGKVNSRAKKADLIDAILELSGVTAPAGSGDDAGEPASLFDDASNDAAADAPTSGRDAATGGEDSGSDDSNGNHAADDDADGANEADAEEAASGDAGGESSSNDGAGSGQRSGNGGARQGRQNQPQGEGRGKRRRRGNNGEPPAEWELELAENDGGKGDGPKAEAKNDGGKSKNRGQNGNQGGGQAGNQNSGPSDADSNEKQDDGDAGNRRRRRRGRGRDRDDEQLPALEPIPATGYLDLRDDGYGFLRVNGYLQSAEDVYVPVKMARQYGLRKGDLVEGTARPANRNEKNPALQTISAINGADPELSRARVRFEELTAVYPFERLILEQPDTAGNSGARLVDLVAPIGKGQRGLIVAPPEAGATELIKQIATAIEANNPEAHLMVLQFDGRPEEIVDIESVLEQAEVGAATFDAPPEDQCALADFTIERAKRMVEAGEDVVIIADGLTTIARAYSLGTQPTGRTIAGVDASALHPTKRFFGAARKLEEAGSLTILATITVGTGAVFDEALFDEFRGTATAEIHLDAWLADEGVFPNIDVELSNTRSADLLADPDDLAAVDHLRQLMATAVDEADGPAVDAARRLVERLEGAATNADFTKDIASATSL